MLGNTEDGRMISRLIMCAFAAAALCGGAFGAEVNVKSGHPKVMLTKEDIARAAKNIEAGGVYWQSVKRAMDEARAPAPAYGLVYLATGDEATGRKGVEVLMAATGAEDIALGYDWLYGLLTEEQKKELFAKESEAVKKDLTWKMDSPWTNFVQRATMRIAMAGSAFASEFPEAQSWVEKAYGDWREFHVPAISITAEGGGWPEGALYGYIVYSSLARLADVFWTATDKNVYEDTRWFEDRITWWRFHTWPMPKDFHGRMFYMYDPYGDSERWRAPMQNQEIAGELVVMRYLGDTDAVREWRWYMKQLDGPIASPGDWAILAYYDETASVKEPTGLSWYAKGTGQIFIRSSWEPTATWIAYQCGPRFTYHQHLDQGAFNIFKEGDLTGESGVYEPSGPSEQEGHLQGYASRAIAHNTINIFNPNEVFVGYRSGNSPRNDGGQRTWRPFSNTATSAAYWRDGFAKGAYDTGTVLEFKDDGPVVYIGSDLTGAYNSDKYVSEPNASKVHEVTRQLVYFRPQREGDIEALVVFDRVRATDPSFEKRLLIHFPNDVRVAGKETAVAEGEYCYEGDFAESDTGGGRLFVRSVWPKAVRMNKVGGPGHEHWVFGKNFPVPDTPWERGYGEWRLEITPKGQQADDCFLTVFFPADKSAGAAPAVTRLIGEDTLGAEIWKDGSPLGRALFAATGDLCARVTSESSQLMGAGEARVWEYGNASGLDKSAKADGRNDARLAGPTVNNVEVSDITTEATVTWKSDRAAVGYVEFGADMNMRYLITPTEKPGREFATVLRGLGPESKFYVRAGARDADGNTGFSAMYELATPADTTAPRISDLKVEQADPTGATVSWSTDDLATGVVECAGEDGSKVSAATAGPAADQRVTIEGLSAETRYRATVTATNPGGLERKSDEVSFSTAKMMPGYFEKNFDDGQIGAFTLTKPEYWAVGKDRMSGSPSLTLSKTPEVRNLAVYDGYEYGDFTLRCRARTLEGDRNAWRDYCVVFGYQDAENYYLVGFNSSVDVDVPGIVRIRGGQAQPIGTRPNLVTIPDRNWHKIMVTRRGAKIQVFWEGLLAFEADDGALGRGKIGFGSNNDEASFDDIRVLPEGMTAPAAAEIRTKKLTVEGLVKE